MANGRMAKTTNGETRTRPASHFGAVITSHTSPAVVMPNATNHSRIPADDRHFQRMNNAATSPLTKPRTWMSVPRPNVQYTNTVS